MNLLEQYIMEVHSVKPYTSDWTKEFEDEFVIVDVTTTSYGRTRRNREVFKIDAWYKHEELGYYMA